MVNFSNLNGMLSVIVCDVVAEAETVSEVRKAAALFRSKGSALDEMASFVSRRNNPTLFEEGES